jgi:hypothetical protein
MHPCFNFTSVLPHPEASGNRCKPARPVRRSRPYVQWCERFSPSAKAGGATYSIVRSFIIIHSLQSP